VTVLEVFDFVGGWFVTLHADVAGDELVELRVNALDGEGWRG
jgi:hypothetical protein